MKFFKSHINIGLTVLLIGISIVIYQLYDPVPPVHTVEKPVTLDSGDENLARAQAPTVSEEHNKQNFTYSDKDDTIKLGTWVGGGDKLVFEERGQISYASLKNSKRKEFNMNKVDKGDKCHLIYYDSGIKIDEVTVTPREGEFSEDKHCEEYWQYISETKYDAIADWGYTIFSNREELQDLSESLDDSVGIGQLSSDQIQDLVDDFRSGEQMREVRVTLTVHTGGPEELPEWIHYGVDDKIDIFSKSNGYDFKATKSMVGKVATKTSLTMDDVITRLLKSEPIIGVHGRRVPDSDVVKLIQDFDEVEQ